MKESTKQLIEKTRAEIIASQKEIDNKYKNLYDQVKSELQDDDADWLFEYIFSCDEKTHHNYLKLVKFKIFGDEQPL